MEGYSKLCIVYKHLPATHESFVNLGLVKEGIYKKIKYVIQNIIDIFATINADLRFGVPETEDSIFDYLGREKVFPEKIISLIRTMKRFRNVLVHRYGTINDAEAFENIKEGKNDFLFIIDEIEKFVKKHQEQQKKKK